MLKKSAKKNPMRIISIKGLYWRSVWSLRNDGKDKKPNFRMVNCPQLRPLKTKTFIQQHQIQLLSWLCMFFFFFPQQPNEGYLIILQISWWVSIYGKEKYRKNRIFENVFLDLCEYEFFFFFGINWLKTVHTKRKYVHDPGFTIFTNPLLDLISLFLLFYFLFWVERDIKVEQKDIFTIVFNRCG